MGWGPNTKKLVHQFPPAMRVGVGPQQRETDSSVSPSNASWGRPQTLLFIHYVVVRRIEVFMAQCLATTLLYI
ncbi:hypothetical protein [Staphylococcus marylandisciuri]|uniref:hypothetical protein n=1 Tax=Staphylococcus marylandisciuri TaxID=2981529 RepID=UPI0021D17A57|nr:hypothetical protein [Staphylococcus marylandisciuri]